LTDEVEDVAPLQLEAGMDREDSLDEPATRLGVGAVAEFANDDAMPNDLLVFAQNRAGQFALRAYPKNQNQDVPSRTQVSAISAPFNNGTVAALGSEWKDFHWRNVKGMTYDPLHHRYLFVEESPTQQARVISMAIGLKGSGDTRNGALVGTVNIYPPDSARVLHSPTGIAYDALSNTLFLATHEGNQYPYYRIIPNAALNTSENLSRIAANR
jgi:hypothetical protein